MAPISSTILLQNPIRLMPSLLADCFGRHYPHLRVEAASKESAVWDEMSSGSPAACHAASGVLTASRPCADHFAWEKWLS